MYYTHSIIQSNTNIFMIQILLCAQIPQIRVTATPLFPNVLKIHICETYCIVIL